MLKRILASTTGSNKNGASKIYYNGKQVYKAYIGSSLVYDVTNGKDFDYTYNSANQKFTFTNWKQTVDGVANTTHFLVKDDPTIIVDLGAITGHNTTIKNISIPYNVPIANNSLARAFSDCSNLTNASISNPNITNMGYSFSNCQNLKSSPFCGDKVTNMIFTYYNCYNLTGQPVVGKNVTNMAAAYANCYNITGNPVCSNVSVTMFEAYRACKKLTGTPVCSPEATSMLWSYYQCHNITGAPVCGNKVTSFRQAYTYCNHLTGNPVCGPNVTDMFGTYSGCKNITGNPVCGDKVTTMESTYSDCRSLTGNPVCGPNVTTMYQAYHACYNLTGAPVCGNKVTNMANAYYLCNNMTGRPVCGDNVTTMFYTYYSCHNLTGQPVCGPNVVNFSAAYSRCYSLSGPAVYGEKVTNMTSSYYQCLNLKGPAIIGENVTAAQHAYCNCGKLSPNAYFFSSKVPSVYNCFAEHAKEVVNVIYVPANSTTLNACLATTQNKSLTNTAITWTNQMTTSGRYYNTTYNISIYPVTNVKQAYKENELLLTTYTMKSGANVVPEVGSATMTTIEDTTNDNGTITRNVYIDESQTANPPKSLSFTGSTDLLKVDKLKMDNIEDATSMFEGCTNLTYVNTNDWDTSKLINTTRMFKDCSSLTTKNSSVKSETLESITNTGQVRTVYIGEMANLISIKGYEGNQLIADVTLSDFVYSDNDSYEYNNSYGYVFTLYENDDESNSYITLQANAPVTGAMTFTVSYLESAPREGFSFNLSNVKFADYMFANCTSLTNADFEIDIVISEELTASVGRPTSLSIGSIDNFVSFSYYGTTFYLSDLEYDTSAGNYRICPGTDTEVVVDEDGFVSLYAIEIDPTRITVYYKEGKTMRDYGFENIESASHMFDGCTSLN
jgi:hypothetical protein